MAETPTPALTAHIDQQETATREMARVLGSYRSALIESQIPEEQASELVAAYSEEYWRKALHRCCPCATWDDD